MSQLNLKPLPDQKTKEISHCMYLGAGGVADENGYH